MSLTYLGINEAALESVAKEIKLLLQYCREELTKALNWDFSNEENVYKAKEELCSTLIEDYDDLAKKYKTLDEIVQHCDLAEKYKKLRDKVQKAHLDFEKILEAKHELDTEDQISDEAVRKFFFGEWEENDMNKDVFYNPWKLTSLTDMEAMYLSQFNDPYLDLGNLTALTLVQTEHLSNYKRTLRLWLKRLTDPQAKYFFQNEWFQDPGVNKGLSFSRLEELPEHQIELLLESGNEEKIFFPEKIRKKIEAYKEKKGERKLGK